MPREDRFLTQEYKEAMKLFEACANENYYNKGDDCKYCPAQKECIKVIDEVIIEISHDALKVAKRELAKLKKEKYSILPEEVKIPPPPKKKRVRKTPPTKVEPSPAIVPKPPWLKPTAAKREKKQPIERTLLDKLTELKSKSAKEQFLWFCPICGTSHGIRKEKIDNKYTQETVPYLSTIEFDPNKPFGVALITLGRGKGKEVSRYLLPGDMPNDFIAVKQRMIQAVKEWIDKEWIDYSDLQ